MADVHISGMFMNAYIHKSTYEGKEKQSLKIDIYQPEAQGNSKTITVSSDDIGLIQKLSKDFAVGSVINVEASVNAYKNNAYFKLRKLVA